MKKIIIFSLLGISLGFSQENTTNQTFTKKNFGDKKHELKFGALKMLGGTIFEGTYEYIQSKDFTYGSSILINFDAKGNDYPEDFSLTPFARFYFQESKEYGAKGFFVEGFGKYSSGTFNKYTDDVEPTKYSAASLGIALGKKWINNSGFVFEILVGAGRTLGNSDVAPDASFRGDLNIGYRF